MLIFSVILFDELEIEIGVEIAEPIYVFLPFFDCHFFGDES